MHDHIRRCKYCSMCMHLSVSTRACSFKERTYIEISSKRSCCLQCEAISIEKVRHRKASPRRKGALSIWSRMREKIHEQSNAVGKGISSNSGGVCLLLVTLRVIGLPRSDTVSAEVHHPQGDNVVKHCSIIAKNRLGLWVIVSEQHT